MIAKQLPHRATATTIVAIVPESLRGRPIEVHIKPLVLAHTSEQQGLYRSLLHEYGKELGYSAKESDLILHESILCETFGILKSLVFRGRISNIPCKRSGKLSIEDYSLLIETLMRLAAEDGIVLESKSV